MEHDRKRVEDMKNGLEQAERFNEFKKKVAECSEIDLFLVIDTLGYIIWRTEHDLAHGRINYPEWDKDDKFLMQAEIELAVEQTARFGAVPFDPDSVKPNESYTKWYRWWKGYVEGMTNEEWSVVTAVIKSGGDYSKYRPQGDWK